MDSLRWVSTNQVLAAPRRRLACAMWMLTVVGELTPFAPVVGAEGAGSRIDPGSERRRRMRGVHVDGALVGMSGAPLQVCGLVSGIVERLVQDRGGNQQDECDRAGQSRNGEHELLKPVHWSLRVHLLGTTPNKDVQ